MAAPLNLAVADIRWPDQAALAGIKHLNRLEQVLAARQARQQGVDDCLMLNAQGQTVSTTVGNLFVYTQGNLLTAPIAQCGIAGTRRQRLMEHWAPAIDLAVEEAALTGTLIENADELFITNSLVGLRPVATAMGRSWHEFPLCSALFEQYRGEMV